MIINHEGQSYDITNWDEFKNEVLHDIGIGVKSEITKQIMSMRLVDTGAAGFKGSIHFVVENGELVITSSSKYARFIEYGTAGRRRGVTDPFGESKPPNPNRKMPYDKKTFGKGREPKLVEGLDKWADRHGFTDKSAKFNLAKHIRDYGMEAFAPFRKVLYNDKVMAKIINNAFRGAGL